MARRKKYNHFTCGKSRIRMKNKDSIRCGFKLRLTVFLYSRIIFSLSSPPLFSSFCSRLLIILQEALLAPITFLYATERRFLSSTVSSTSILATFFIDSTISERSKIETNGWMSGELSTGRGEQCWNYHDFSFKTLNSVSGCLKLHPHRRGDPIRKTLSEGWG